MNKIYDFICGINFNDILKKNALNNRELAYLTIIVSIILVVIFLNKDKKILLSFKELLKTMFCRKFVIVIIILIIWILLICYFLKKIHIWNWNLIKSTLLWFITTGIFTVFKVIQMDKSIIEKYLMSILVNSFKITVIVDFIQNTYVFNYWIELGLGVIILIIGLINTVIEISKDKNIMQLKNIMNKIFTTIGVIWVILIFYKIITQPKELIDLNNLKELIVNIILTISMMIPTYLLSIYVSYENIFIRLELRENVDKPMKIYIKFKIILYAKLNIKKLDIKYYQNIFWLSNRKEIKHAFEMLKDKK